VVARAGRREFYKTMAITVPAVFSIPTYDSCGDERLKMSQSKALDLALEKVYGQELLRLAGEQLAKIADAGLEQKRVEHARGLRMDISRL
jgi:hypothetical protein